MNPLSLVVGLIVGVLGRLLGVVSALFGVVAAVLRVFSPPAFIWRALGFTPDRFYITAPLDAPLVTVGSPAPLSLDDIPSLHAEMKAIYASGYSRPIAKRREQLTALRSLIADNEALFLGALASDLGRPPFEGLFYDVLLPLSEVDDLLSHLDEWAAPDYKSQHILTLPSTNALYKEPYGTCLVIGTWNYAMMLSLIPLAGAIAAGNNVVLKPCNVASATATLLGELIPRYMDPKIVSVVGPAIKGDRATTAALLDHPWDHIFFTGSPTVGRIVMQGAAKFLTPVVLELGGKNAVFVDTSAPDIDLAAKRTVWGRMMNAGQQCIAPDFVLVHQDVADAFIDAAAGYINSLYANPDDIGRIVGDKQMARLVAMLENSGGDVICGGNYDIDSRYIAPTLVRCSLDSPAMDDETFGPILWVVPVPNMDMAIRYMQSRPKPLSQYIFADHDTAMLIVHNTSAGGTTINGTLFHVAHPDLPFGGVGNSGIGAYHGKATFDTFCHQKPVLIKHSLPDAGLLSDPFFLYPPWSDLKIRILRIVAKLL